MAAPKISSDDQCEVVDSFLESRSYITGNEPSTADLALFELTTSEPNSKFVNFKRWYNHIGSFNETERKSFVDVKQKDLSKFGLNIPAAAVDEDEVDLFGSDDDEDTEEQERIKQERLAMYEAKKATKVKPAAKSSVVFDIKPWEDTTDLVEMEKRVRQIEMDGLIWGASKLVPVAFGIKKLQISTVIEDDKVSTDVLEENIMSLEEFVQSVDIVSFNKL